jgi:butyryl-CoA dehydrogenase
MMNYELSPQYLALQKTVREFVEAELAPGVLERDEKSEFPIEQFRKLGKLGFIGLQYPKEYGGQGLDYVAYVLATEEISKVDASLGIAYSVTNSLFGGALMAFASEEQKKKYLPKIFSGESIGCFALTEPNAGSDAAGVVTTAEKSGDGYVINGTKCFMTNGPLADYAMLVAMTDKSRGTKGLSAFIIEKGVPGFSIGRIENKMGIRSAQVSELLFKDCKVPASCLMGKEGDGFKVAMKALDGGRIGVAAQGLGIAKGAFEIARKYLMTREQFGQPLYKNQYLAFKMVELGLLIEQAEMMLYKAATDQSEGRPYTLPAAKAKLLCTNAAMTVSTEAVQMLGGNGFMKEYHVERMMRDAKITQIYEGTNEIQKLIISGSLFR